MNNVLKQFKQFIEKLESKNVKGEDLNVIAGNTADENAKKDKFKQFILNLLKEKKSFHWKLLKKI